MQKQTKPEPLVLSTAKLVLVVAIIVCLGAVFGAVGYLAINKLAKIQQPQVSPASEPTKSIKDGTADWKTYRNEEYGFEVKYPTEWGDVTSTKVEDVTIGWYGVIYFSFKKEDDVYFSIINIEDWPDGIYEQGYEGVDLLKIDMNKQKQVIEENECYESVSSQYNKAFKFQMTEDCQIIFLPEDINVQLDYPYFVPMFSLAKEYTFYKKNYRFTFGLRSSELRQILFEQAGREREHEQETIKKVKNLLKKKVVEGPYTNPAIISLLDSFDQMVSTFRFLDWQLFGIEEYGFSMKIHPDYKKTREEEIERETLKMKLVVFSKDGEKIGITIDREPDTIKTMRPVLLDALKLEPEEWRKSLEYYSNLGLVEPGTESVSKENIETGTCMGIQLLEKKEQKYKRNLILTSRNLENMYVTILFEYYTKDAEAEVFKMVETIECTK